MAPSCTDGVVNGAETDVDCGGSCPGCPTDSKCTAAGDCTSSVCSAGHCLSASCTDGVVNGDETDVDCGGKCGACPDARGCDLPQDCRSGICSAHLCEIPRCTDGVRNGGETGVDCGGSCPMCVTGAGCRAGADCASGVCRDDLCRAPACTDGVKNGGETEVDCGGGCAPCAAGKTCAAATDCSSRICDPASHLCREATCSDGVTNGLETSVDCGGGICRVCLPGTPCRAARDCLWGLCAAGTCAQPSCADGVKSGGESDVDCGPGCGRCADGRGCRAGTDCTSGVCTGGACQPAGCADNVSNGAETDVDCGGGTCPACLPTRGCRIGGDCTSGVCAGGICQAPTCIDTVKNGAETDVDCGGGTCGTCPATRACALAADCASGVCTSNVCQAPTCIDTVKNGAETDVDCGGGTCGGCANGKACLAASDCASGNCQSSVCGMDVTAPGTTTLNVARSLTSRSQAALSWLMAGDDGATGTVASYEIRYLSCAIGASCPVTDVNFATGTLVPNLPAVAAGGTSMNVTATGLPLAQTISWGIRFVDDAGNSSLSTATSSSDTTSTSIAGDAFEVDYGFAMVSVPLKGGAAGDLVIGRPRKSNLGGGLRVVYADGSATADIAAAQVGLVSASARMGRALANAGDVDGDGYPDLLVGAPGIADANCTNGVSGPTGRAYLFFGGPSGLRGAASPVACSAPGATDDCYVEILPPGGSGVCSFGVSLAGGGFLSDQVGQTRSYFAIGASDLLTTSTRVGKVFVYRVTGDRPNITVELATTLSGAADDYHFGASLCGVGDVTGDAIPDLVVGAHRRGQTPVVAGRGYLIYGGARFSGVGAAETMAGQASATDGLVRLGDQVPNDFFGTDCEGLGDMNGDGTRDFAISAPGGLRVYVFRGRSDFDAMPSMASPDVVNVNHPSWTQPGELAGGGTDFDGDGRPDLIVGDAQAVFVFSGNATTLVSSTPAIIFMQSSTVATGFPVVGLQNFRSAALGESYPDLAIGKVSGPSVTIQY